MPTIASIHAREILDSRGNPTVEVDLILSDGSFGRASVPSGTSTGTHEAVELRDNDIHRFHGKGTKQAVVNVNLVLSHALVGQDADQQAVDQKMSDLDGTENKSKLGANALLGISLALSKALAASRNKPLYESIRIDYGIEPTIYLLPVPLMNIINGGRHAAGSTDIQEFMIVPTNADSFSESLRMGAEIFHSLKKLLEENGQPTTVGDEGGFAPEVSTNQEALDLLIAAINKAGYKPHDDVLLALDCASSEFYNNEQYQLKSENTAYTSADLTTLYQTWSENYPLISIEDPLAQDDWQGYKNLTEKLGKKIQIVGDDLFATNTNRLQKGIDEQVANAILIKPNQIGTLTQTVATVHLAQHYGYNTIISHRSGETEDTTIADLAVALNAGQIKTGSACRGERIAKYNQLLRIEEQLGKKATFSARLIFKTF